MAKDIRVTLELDNRQFNRAINQSKGQVDSFKTGSVASLGAIRTAFLAIGGAAVTKSIVDTGASFQQLQNSLNVVFGSAEAGAAAFERVQDIASGTQFSVQQLTQAFVQLKGAGVEPTEELLQTFADTASVTTDQMGTFQAALDLVSRSTAGGLGLEDLNRLADRGIPVFRILQERLGLARLEVSEFGKTTEGANQIIRELLAGLQEDFGGALAGQFGLINFELDQLGDAFDKLQNAVFKTFEEDAASAIQGLTDAVNNLADNTKGIARFMSALGGIVEIVVGAFVFLKVGAKDVTSGFVKLADKIKVFFVGSAGVLGLAIKNFKDLGFALRLVVSTVGGLLAGRASIGALGVALAYLGAPAAAVAATITAVVLALDGLIRIFTDTSLFGLIRDLGVALGIITPKFEENTEAVKQNAHVLAFEAEQARLNEEAAKANAKQKELNKIAEDAFAKGLRSSTKAIEEQTGAFDKNDPLSSYQELLSDVLGTANDTAVEQVFAARAIKAVTDMYENGLLPLRTYNIAIEQLKSLTGETPFADFMDSLEGVTLTTEEYAEKQKELNALLQKYPEYAEEAAKAQDELDDALKDNEGLASFLQTLGQAQKRLSEDLATALMEGKSASESFKDFFRTLVTQLIADALRLAVIQPILSSIFGITFGPGGAVSGLSGGGLLGFLGFRAEGGPVMKNRPYIVGERGPELMVPGSSGTIIPNNMLGGGQTNVTYNINAVDAPSFQQLVAQDPEFIYSVTRAGARRLPGVA